MFDYFLKIDSNVKSDGPYYHDMNGFLVSKKEGSGKDWITNGTTERMIR